MGMAVKFLTGPGAALEKKKSERKIIEWNLMQVTRGNRIKKFRHVKTFTPSADRTVSSFVSFFFFYTFVDINF